MEGKICQPMIAEIYRLEKCLNHARMVLRQQAGSLTNVRGDTAQAVQKAISGLADRLEMELLKD